MGNPLADHMQLRLATLAATEPDKRIIGVGNPSGPRQGIGTLRFKELRKVWDGDLRPTVDPILRYLSSQAIETAVHIGYSYGADKAASATEYSDSYDLQVSNGVFMEPVGIRTRKLLELGKDFYRSGSELDNYVNAADSNPVIEAASAAAEKSHGLRGFALGLLRLSNIAIEHALTKPLFDTRVIRSLKSQDSMEATVVWGSESEISTHSYMLNVIKDLKHKFNNRIKTITLENQKHAMGDDIFLHTALVMQSLQ
jgi:pimeloyl-ACP methyl ester carboxylesterase